MMVVTLSGVVAVYAPQPVFPLTPDALCCCLLLATSIATAVGGGGCFFGGWELMFGGTVDCCRGVPFCVLARPWLLM